MRNGFTDFGRFSDISLLILLSLAAGEKHGYAIIEDIARFSGIKPEPGSLYGALMRLEQRGWIEPLPAADRRHPYQLTPAGKDSLRLQVATLERLVATGVERLALA